VKLFITCAQALEGILEQELRELGYEKIEPGFRGVHLEVPSIDAIYRINYCSRIASRVLLPILNFRCYDAKTLYRNIYSIDWVKYLPQGKTFAIDANVSHRHLRNSLFAAQVAKDAICDQFREAFGKRPSIDTKAPDVQLNLFIHDENGVISIDTSGMPLHKRGYRQDSVEAPLNESLAAAMLRIAGYRGDEIVCDPCCGSGTLLIEAAMMASKTPPGYLRQKWGFMYLPEFSQLEWLKVKADADQKRSTLPFGMYFGCDINKSAIQVSRVNLRASGFQQFIEIVQRDFREFKPPKAPNFIITNPPHGKRLDDVDSLRLFYRSLGDFMKRESAKPGRGFVFTSSLELTKEVGLAAKKRTVLASGGDESRLLEFDLF